MEPNRVLKEILSKLGTLDFSHVRKISAVPMSLYSDLREDENTFWDLCVPRVDRRNPDRLLSYLIVYSLVRPEWYSLLVIFMEEQCYRFGYQGKWRKLHKLLKTNHSSLILYRLTELYSPGTIFGNILPDVQKVVKETTVHLEKRQRPRAIRPQRKRGYDDHGSRKLPHEIHSCASVSGQNPVKPDFRNQLKKSDSVLNFLWG